MYTEVRKSDILKARDHFDVLCFYTNTTLVGKYDPDTQNIMVFTGFIWLKRESQ